MKIAIIGLGWVGKAMQKLFPDAIIYNRKIQNKDEINTCDVAFICVPTPNPQEERLDTSIVEEQIQWLETPLVVIRSTINPGDCDRWIDKYNIGNGKIKHLIFQPEYLGETPAHPMLDPKTRQFLILGGSVKGVRELINIYTTVYNANVTINHVSWREAEIIKLTENRAIAFKVAQCQELYDVCEKDGVDYYTIRDAVFGDDPRFNLWWTFVFPNNRGFNSKCIPKDIYAWCAWAESLGYKPKITRAILKKNKEWIQNSR